MKTKAHDLDVDVQHEIKSGGGGLTVITLTATCGGTKHGHSITVGAVNGFRPAPPTAAELQKVLDDGRSHAANESAWKESVRLASTQIS